MDDFPPPLPLVRQVRNELIEFTRQKMKENCSSFDEGNQKPFTCAVIKKTNHFEMAEGDPPKLKSTWIQFLCDGPQGESLVWYHKTPDKIFRFEQKLSSSN